MCSPLYLNTFHFLGLLPMYSLNVPTQGPMCFVEKTCLFTKTPPSTLSGATEVDRIVVYQSAKKYRVKELRALGDRVNRKKIYAVPTHNPSWISL